MLITMHCCKNDANAISNSPHSVNISHLWKEEPHPINEPVDCLLFEYICIRVYVCVYEYVHILFDLYCFCCLWPLQECIFHVNWDAPVYIHNVYELCKHSKQINKTSYSLSTIWNSEEMTPAQLYDQCKGTFQNPESYKQIWQSENYKYSSKVFRT